MCSRKTGVIVADAGVILEAVVFIGALGPLARRRQTRQRVHAPELVDLEVASALRRLVRRGSLTAEQATYALSDLRRARITRHSHRPFLPRIWELRDNVSAYDAAYVAIAERADATLLTLDRRLAQAHGPRCRIEVLGD